MHLEGLKHYRLPRLYQQNLSVNPHLTLETLDDQDHGIQNRPPEFPKSI